MTKRNHHYVPRFYLKKFASDPREPKQINLYNIPGSRIICNASLRDQCYKRRFYGETNEVEDLLASLEGAFASVVRKICDTKSLPIANTEEHSDLLLFISTQILRTTKSAENLNTQTDEFMKMILSRDSRFSQSDLNKVKIGLNHPVLFALSNSLKMAFCLDDLEMHLFEAAVNTEFITSDNPVFSYNIYRERCPEPGATGSVSLGLLLFLPLSPQLCLLLYDYTVYKVGQQRNNKRVSVLTNNDMRRINALQFVGAETNLYFSTNISFNCVNQIARSYSRVREKTGLRTVEFEEEGNSLRTLVLQYQYVPNLRLNLSSVSIRRDVQRVPLQERINKYRREVPKLPRNTTDQYNHQQEDSRKRRFFRRVK